MGDSPLERLLSVDTDGGSAARCLRCDHDNSPYVPFRPQQVFTVGITTVPLSRR